MLRETNRSPLILAAILGLGVVFPLASSPSLGTATILSLSAIGSLALFSCVIVIVRPLLSRNARVGVALLFAAFLPAAIGLSIGSLSDAPFHTLVPLLIIVAVMLATAKPRPKGKNLVPSLRDSMTIALGFSILVCLGGLMHDLTAGRETAGGEYSLGLFSLPFAIFLLSAVIVSLTRLIADRRRGRVP